MRDAVPVEGWNESGQWEGLRWSATSTPFEAAAGNAVALHRVQIDVVWSDGLREQSFSLVSLRPQQAAQTGAGR
jgi:general secretion pathway protein I